MTVIGMAVVACHGGGTAARPAVASRTASASRTAVSGRAFGDTISGGVRILTLDRENEIAGITVRNTKNLIVLAVVPGREIEVIMPGGLPLRRDRQAGHYFVDMRRVDDNIRPMNADEDAAARLAYDRCMAQAAATERRLAQQKRTVKRDSTGKVIDDGGRGEAISVDQQRALQASCDRLADTKTKTRATVYLPARPPADRYLVVLSSSSPIPLSQLYERLATLTAVAPDVATTIEAIAAGLFVGVKGTWGGYFVAW